MEEFFSENQMYIVLGIVLLVWAGIISYLLRLDNKVKSLENLMKKG
jgi:CcmD family protein